MTNKTENMVEFIEPPKVNQVYLDMIKQTKKEIDECLGFSIKVNMEALEKSHIDGFFLGTGYVKFSSDGKIERIEPAKVVLLTKISEK